MTKPDFTVRIKGKEFDCLGEQLVSILDTIKPKIQHVTWYVSDVEAMTKPPFTLRYISATPKRIGSTADRCKLSCIFPSIHNCTID